MLCRAHRRNGPAWLLLVLLGCGAPPPGARALDPGRRASQLDVQSWTVEHGLPDAYVQAVTQTRDGWLWLGTQNGGLVRFDGVRFTRVRAGLDSGDEVSVRAFCETGDGALWVATDGAGVWRHAAGRFTRYGRAEGLPIEHVFALHEDAEGTLWAGVAAHYAVRLEGGRFVQPEPLRRLPRPGSVYALRADRTGGLWLAGQGLWRLAGGELTAHHASAGVPGERFLDVAEAADGTVWVASTHGVLRLRDGEATRFSEADGLSDRRTRSVLVDRDGVLWVGSSSGLDRHEGGRFVPCLTREQRPFDLVYAVFEDREGSLWIGSNGGLARLKDEKFAFLTTREGLPQNIVTCALEARDGALWLGTWTKGLARHGGDSVRIYTRREGLAGDGIRCLHEDARGVLWVGTDTGGLSRIVDGSAEQIPPEALEGARSVVAIQEDPAGRLWLLAEDGRLLQRTGEGFAVHGDFGAGTGQRGQALHAGRGGGLWLATESALAHMRDGVWTGQALPAELAGLAVRSLHEDGEGALWLCAQGEGLVRFRAGRFEVFGARHGLPMDNFYGMAEDERGDLWVTCKRGVFLLSRQELREHDAGRRAAFSPVDFTTLGGMHNPRFLRYGHPPVARLRDGRLCFPTTKGAALVDPARPYRNPRPPPLIIEQVLADRVPLAESAGRLLPRRTRDVEIHYTALGLRTPERVRFRYRLEGRDTDWIEAGPRRVAYYQNLPPGEYRFRVLAANEDGVWNEVGAELALVQRPLFHQTRGFHALAAAAVLGAGLGWHRHRIRRQRRQFELRVAERTRIARDLHDTLEQGLVAVSMQLNLAARQTAPLPHAADKHLQKARFMLRHCMEEARASVLDLRRGGPDQELHLGLERLAGSLSVPGGPAVVVRESGRRRPLPAPAAETLLRVAQEAVTNAVKHAHAGRVEVAVRYAAQAVTLRIRDDGRGFDAAAPQAPGHFGLLGMRERCEKLRAVLRLDSAPGRGTTVTVTVPAPATVASGETTGGHVRTDA